jgi:hypothetical protein
MRYLKQGISGWGDQSAENLAIVIEARLACAASEVKLQAYSAKLTV